MTYLAIDYDACDDAQKALLDNVGARHNRITPRMRLTLENAINSQSDATFDNVIVQTLNKEQAYAFTNHQDWQSPED